MANSKTIRSRVPQPASAGKEADLVNCKLITACYLTIVQCVTSANKLSLQELTQLIKIKQLISRFPEILPS